MKIKAILASETADHSIEGAFLAIRLLKQQLGITTKKTNNSFEIPPELDAKTVRRVADQLLEAVQQGEGTPIRKLKEKTILAYVDRLSREVERLSSKEVKVNKTQAANALHQMRRQINL